MASAACSRESNPSNPDCMNRVMRWMPAALVLGVMSTRTRPQETVRSLVPSASMADIPPNEAPTSTGGRPQLVGHGHAVGAEGGEGVVAVGRPVTVAVTPQVEGHGPPALTGHDLGRRAPGVTGLPSAVQEEHRPGVRVTPLTRQPAADPRIPRRPPFRRP